MKNSVSKSIRMVLLSTVFPCVFNLTPALSQEPIKHSETKKSTSAIAVDEEHLWNWRPSTPEEKYRWVPPRPERLEEHKGLIQQYFWVLDEYKEGRANYKDAFAALKGLAGEYFGAGDIDKGNELSEKAYKLGQEHPELLDTRNWADALMLSEEIDKRWEAKRREEYKKAHPKEAAEQEEALKRLKEPPKKDEVDHPVRVYCYEDTCVEKYRYRLDIIDMGKNKKKTITFSDVASMVANGKYLGIHCIERDPKKNYIDETALFRNFIGTIDLDGNIVWDITNKKDWNVKVIGTPLTAELPELDSLDVISRDGKVILHEGWDGDRIHDPVVAIYPDTLIIFGGKAATWSSLTTDGKHILLYGRRSDDVNKIFFYETSGKLLWTYPRPSQFQLSPIRDYVLCMNHEYVPDKFSSVGRKERGNVKELFVLDKNGQKLWGIDVDSPFLMFEENERAIIVKQYPERASRRTTPPKSVMEFEIETGKIIRKIK